MPLTKVSSGVIAANAVVDSFGTQSITGDKLGLTAINANNIVGGAVTGDKIATGQITGNLLTANCVSGNNIVSSPTITGNVTINGSLGVGGATPAASGFGIKFPGTQSASTDANTLDDYEEGTWTPVIADDAVGGNTGTFTNAGATYTKIGRQVTIQAYLNAINTTGMTGGNILFIRGLPFTSASTAQGNFYTYRMGRDASTVSSSVNLGGSSTTVNFNLYTTNSATVDKYILVSNIVSGTSEIIFSITYFA